MSISNAVNGFTADIDSCSIISALIGPRLGNGKNPAAGATISSAQVLPLARRTNWSTARFFTPGDTSVTRPTPSLPLIWYKSEGLIGAAKTFTRTSPSLKALAASVFTLSTSAGLPSWL